MEAALADAASKAATIATASHVRLGPILDVTSAARNDEQQIIVTGTRLQPVPAPPPPPPPVPVKITPEPLTTNSYITVTYAIEQ